MSVEGSKGFIAGSEVLPSSYKVQEHTPFLKNPLKNLQERKANVLSMHQFYLEQRMHHEGILASALGAKTIGENTPGGQKFSQRTRFSTIEGTGSGAGKSAPATKTKPNTAKPSNAKPNTPAPTNTFTDSALPNYTFNHVKQADGSSHFTAHFNGNHIATLGTIPDVKHKGHHLVDFESKARGAKSREISAALMRVAGNVHKGKLRNTSAPVPVK